MAHRSRLAGFIIDCRTDGLDAATDFRAQALGCTVAERDAGDAAARYQRLGETSGDLHIEVQQVEHASRVHSPSRRTTCTPRLPGWKRWARRRSPSCTNAGG
ncbi:hypothetical protein [Thermomonas alba]|uniref:hypothetical protein n=1 Tax=Thermomonas alba TaxID=2888525 RepID=UPI003F7005F6